MDVSWSQVDGQDCIRVRATHARAGMQVRPAAAAALGAVPSTAGRVVVDGADRCFVPRFPFVDGTTYAVSIDGGADQVFLARAVPERIATSEVLAIYPSSPQVPRNLLRLYVWFSAPMSDGYAADHVRLIDGVGRPIAGALLPGVNELWDPGRRRLTLLLDPARIKRGLSTHVRFGYPLRTGEVIRLIIDDGFPDAHGTALRARGEREYQIGADERRHVEPESWSLAPAALHTTEALQIGFDRPLDHGLLTRCLRLIGPDGRRVDGISQIGPGEQSWRLIPRRPWAPGTHRLVVDPELEDLAGNSLTRVFDRDLTRGADTLRPRQAVAVTFRPI